MKSMHFLYAAFPPNGPASFLACSADQNFLSNILVPSTAPVRRSQH